MGIDPNQIKYLSYFIEKKNLHLDEDIPIVMDGVWNDCFFTADTRYKDFRLVGQWANAKYKCGR